MTISKNILIQYSDMKEEIKDLHRRIEQLERELYKMEEEGTVKDTVTGGLGGTQHFVVERRCRSKPGKKKQRKWKGSC